MLIHLGIHLTLIITRDRFLLRLGLKHYTKTQGIWNTQIFIFIILQWILKHLTQHLDIPPLIMYI
jgi:hypothetical protein